MSGKGLPKRILIVDGYNVLNVRRKMTDSASLADARDALILELQDYAGFSGQRVVVVFDAYQGDRKTRSEEEHGPVKVVFTRKSETADHYIEHLCDEYADDIDYRRVEVRVATSDALEQTIILGRGATRLSARELLLEMQQVRSHGVSSAQTQKTMKRSMIGDRIPEHVLAKMREIARQE